MGSMVVRQMGAMRAEMLIRRAEMDYPAGEQKDARIVDYVDQEGERRHRDVREETRRGRIPRRGAVGASDRG
jgi:hypothetical protein